MKRKILIIAICFVAVSSLVGQIPSGDEIMRRVDANLVIDEAVTTATMIIHGRTGTRKIKSKSWNKGRDNTFVEYLSPARERGKKMLKSSVTSGALSILTQPI